MGSCPSLHEVLEPETIVSALRLEALAARLKEYIVRIFYGNDSRILKALLPMIAGIGILAFRQS
jgi:hypothetical protein